MYINPNNEYPRFYGDIQLENPNWNLGDELPDGWTEVQQTPAPETGEYEIAYEEFPVEQDGVFIQNWTVRPMTAEEKERRDAPKTARQKLKNLGLTEVEIDALLRGLI